jgi:hypothetical protein
MKSLTASRSGFEIPSDWLGKRAEQIPVADYIHLAEIWSKNA